VKLLFALFVIGVGVWMIVTAHDPTETLTARVSASRVPFTRADKVDFKFANGSEDDVVSPTAEGFFDAVATFGPGPARVTRNAANDTIYKVEFHGKTYTLDSPGTDLGGGIIVVVLGALGLAYIVVTSRGRRGPLPAAKTEIPTTASATEPAGDREAFDDTMDRNEVEKVVKRFFKVNLGATLELPDGWFGRPFDNHHELASAGWEGPLLRIVLDRDEPLTLLIREPQHADVDNGVLTIRGFAEASAELPYYGDRDHPTRLKKYTGGTFCFHPN
jgi:hypothetical protein